MIIFQLFYDYFRPILPTVHLVYKCPPKKNLYWPPMTGQFQTLSSHKWNLSQICVFVDILTIQRNVPWDSQLSPSFCQEPFVIDRGTLRYECFCALDKSFLLRLGVEKKT